MLPYKYETNPFVKVEIIRQIIRKRYGNLSDKDILSALCKLNRHKYGTAKIDGFHEELDAYLNNNGINGAASYRLLLEVITPEDINRGVYTNHKLTDRKAKQIAQNNVEKEKATITLEILRMGRSLVRRL